MDRQLKRDWDGIQWVLIVATLGVASFFMTKKWWIVEEDKEGMDVYPVTQPFAELYAPGALGLRDGSRVRIEGDYIVLERQGITHILAPAPRTGL